MQTFGERARDTLHFGDRLLGKRHGRRDGSGIAGMTPRCLDVLENRPHHRCLAVGHAIDVQLDCMREELVDEDGAAFRYLHRLFHELPEPLLVVDDRHAASAKHERGPHEHGIADLGCDLQSVVDRVGDSAWRLPDANLLHERAEEIAVLGEGNVVRRGAEHVHARCRKALGEVERGLSPELHDRAVATFALVDLHHVLERERLEVELVRGVVVGGDGLGVGVDHHDLVAALAQGERRVAAAPVELDALPDAVGPAAQDHDLVAGSGLLA